MCGIAGCRLGSSSPDKATLTAMAAAMNHRGPDDTGVLITGAVGLAHTRLSLLDLSEAGHQPMLYRDWAIVYNGEIYNFRKVRTLLESRGERFLTGTDTEVLLRALVQLGIEETLRIAKGMFAFALCHMPSGTLHLARDRYGIKPLFFLEDGRDLWFCSEAKAIRAARSLEPDPVVAAFSLTGMADHSAEYSPFNNLRQIHPGCWATAAPGRRLRFQRYYDLDHVFAEEHYRELEGLSFDEAVDHLESLLGTAVEATLISDAPIGTFVSGGIDSSLVAHMASSRRNDVQLFTSNVLGRHSEVDDARVLADSLDIPLHEAPFPPEAMVERWSAATWHYECPIVTHTNAIPFGSVAELAHKRGVKAVLTGEGADELFLGYPKLAADFYKRPLARPVELAQALYGVAPGLREYVFPRPQETVEGFVHLVAQGFERQHQRKRSMERYAFVPARHRSLQYHSAQMLREGLLALLHRNDRMGMSASIESRFPYLDEDVVAFALNLPVHHKIRFSRRFHDRKHPFRVDKAIVRALGDRHLPTTLTRKRKIGFPMYGHRNVRMKKGAFHNGYVADLFSLTGPSLAYIYDQVDPYFIARHWRPQPKGGCRGGRPTHAS